MPKIISIEQAARQAKVTPATILEWLRLGKISGKKKRPYAINKKSLTAYLKQPKRCKKAKSGYSRKSFRVDPEEVERLARDEKFFPLDEFSREEKKDIPLRELP